jgi:DNA polymerase III epsilon subunit-like protein
MNLIVDIETTGLPANFKGKYTDLKVYNPSRIVQLSFIKTDFKDFYKEYDYIIKRDGFEITNSHIHGITNEISDKEGVEIEMALRDFLEAARNTTIYTHNANFDITIIKSELYRYDMRIPPLNVVCTMLKYTKPNQKYVKLIDLYSETMGKTTKQTHNALDDCKMLYDILRTKNI